MKRIVVISIIFSSLFFGALHPSVRGVSAHDTHGSMGSAADCMTASCPMDAASATNDCIAHCLSAASKGNLVTPIVVAIVFTAVILAAYAAARSAPAAHFAYREDFLGKLLLHQRLSTVVLRN